MSHDQRFKDLIVDYPRDALRLFAPAEAGDLPDDVAIRPVRQEKLSERFGDARRFLDVPLEVRFPSGQREAIAFVIEEETVARFFDPTRLGHYLLDLARLLNTTRVAAVVIFLRGPPSTLEFTLGTERMSYLSLTWHSCVLPQRDAHDWEHSDNLVARLNLLNMRHRPDERLRLYGASLEGLVRFEPRPRMRAKYNDFIDAYACLTEDEMLRFEDEELSRREDASMEYWQVRQQQLRQEGVLLGREEGREEGRVEVLLGVLGTRGFELSPEMRQRLESERDPARLVQWTIRAVSASSVDEVFNDLD